jgi:hypothetical protein
MAFAVKLIARREPSGAVGRREGTLSRTPFKL